MDHSYMENTYLKETPLTSTKNKFILDKWHGYSEKYSFHKGLHSFNSGVTYAKKRKSEDTNPLTSTENKFLKDTAFKKKKKKLRKSCPASRSMRSASRECDKQYCDTATDVLDGMMSDENLSSAAPFGIFGGVSLVPREPAGSIAAFDAMPQSCSAFVPSPPLYSSNAVTEAGFMNVIMPQKLAAPGFSFGSACPPTIGLSTRAFQKPMLRSAAALNFESFIEIHEMPVYNFESSEQFEVESCPSFERKDAESTLAQLERIQSVKNKKMQFLNATSMALIFSSNLKDSSDSFRIFLQKCADDVRSVDPEFILKVALYSRQEMHIRSATNFLLSYAAYYEDTRPYLEKYFEICIRLPSDWIEVADLYQIFHDDRLKHGSLPTALRKVMIKSFEKFDAYQLAKYNRDKRKKGMTSHSIESETDNNEERNFSQRGFTIKQLVRLLHLNSPANEIMCLLGKKYPDTFEAFKKSGLPGAWDSKRAGQRMKLPQPETWEIQVSSHGNKAHIWEGLIDNSKLPYMAMLRNLRNLLLSGISPKHHEKILQYLKNKNAVMNSKQLPLQFYEAFKTVNGLEEILNGCTDENDKKVPMWRKQLQLKMSQKIRNTSSVLLKRYADAVSYALEISSLHNLPLIPGRTLVICDVLQPKEQKKHIRDKAYYTCIMMGLMCLKACEDCKMSLTCGSYSKSVDVDENCSFLKNMMDICSKHKSQCDDMLAAHSMFSLNQVLEFHLKQQTILKEKLDQVIYLRNYGDSHTNYVVKELFSSFLLKYRQIVNPELLFTHVDVAQSTSNFNDLETSNEKDVYLSGNNTQLLKFIAERSSGGQLSYVENIDLKYNLSDTNLNKLAKFQAELSESVASPLYSKLPKWHTVRIFISSTFKDMHCERDMLIRYVFPELRRRAASVFVKINEVDLRWGITETDCTTKRASELCLLEAQKSDLFVGILGERYGTTFNFDPPDSPDLQWVKDYPSGLSITELEMYAGALRENKLKEGKAFFYFRNSAFLSLVPLKWQSYFSSESEDSKKKVEDLKSKIRSSGVKVLDGYGCKWAGVLKNKPILSGLDAFGKAVLDDLWIAVCKMHENDPFIDDVTEEEVYQQHLLDSFDYYVERKDSPMDLFVQEIKKTCGIFLISGTPGSGKTTFSVNLLKKLRNFSIIKFFIGLTPRSTDLTYMLQYICNSIVKNYPVSTLFPKLTKDVMNNFPDILHEAVSSSGNRDIVLMIDGLDHLEVEDQMMDWLPHSLPYGLRLIFTASDSSYAFKVLCDRQMDGTPLYMCNLTTMVQSDRECIVRHYLKLYGKVLDESPFNNQMLLMVTKRDSGIPLYLRISCDFLRSYASFENFMSTLQSLPSTLPLLLQEIILQMENEYSSILIQTALTLLCITKEGLDDADLHFLLSLAALEEGKYLSLTFEEILEKIKKMGPDDMLSHVTYCSLVHTICTFAFGHNRFKRFNLSGSEFEKAVKKYYLNKNYSNFTEDMHSCLAAYFHVHCDPTNNGLWNGHSALAFRGLVHHLFHGQCYNYLSKCLCCLKFLQAVFTVGAADALLEYYSLLLDKSVTANKEAIRDIDFAKLLSFNDFVTRNLHVFQSYPHLVSQQALNEPVESLVKFDQENSKSSMVECLSHFSRDSRVATLGGFVKNITAAACEEARPVALLGSEDGYLKVLDFTSKRIVRNVKSHTSSITFICFAGENRICTASTDTTLSIWSTVDYNRVCLLKGHKHCVSCCCADLTSNIILSSGWDNSVRLWSMRDGRSISVIDDFRCPVNCLNHHPIKQQVACGLWSGNIEIWDTLSLKKLLVLESNYRSVKSLAYMPDGINIISSYMNSDVIIWSSEQGLKISSMKGHVLPVKSISYSYLSNMIISGSDDCTLKVWPTESGLCVCSISECKFCPINLLEIISINLLAISFQNSEIWVLDIHKGNVLSKMKLEFEKISCFSGLSSTNCTSNDLKEHWVDSSLVLGSRSGEIIVGDILTSSLKTVGSINNTVTSIIHNRTLIICGNSDGDIGVFTYPEIIEPDIVSGAHKGSVSSLSLTVYAGKLCLLSASTDKIIKFWIIDENNFYEKACIEFKYEYISKHKDVITCCFISDFDNKIFLTGSHDNDVILQRGDSVNKFQGLETSVLSVDLNDAYIIGCGSDGSIAIWSYDAKLLSFIPGIEQSSAILSFRIDKDSANEFDVTLAFADIDGSVKVRKPNERSFYYSLEGHSKSVTSCCPCPNGEILSSSLDGTVNLWKIPIDNQNIYLHHLAAVTDIIISKSCNFALSSDAHGNIVLWVLDATNCSPLMYSSKKSYIGGYIKALSWLQDRKFVCAVTQIINNEEKYFLDIIGIDASSMNGKDVYNLQVKCSHYFESEVLCLDTRCESNCIVAGFKSGSFIIITNNAKKVIKLCEDWILGIKTMQNEDNSVEYLFLSLLNGTIRRYETNQVLGSDYSFRQFPSSDLEDVPPFNSVLCCENDRRVFCGDTQGYLRIYTEKKLSSKKVHDDSITGISVIGPYAFTCSLDRTVKGWNISTLQQVCQYHSTIPITSVRALETITDGYASYLLLIGTTSGAVYLLKFYAG